jgi:hypothetical protein
VYTLDLQAFFGKHGFYSHSAVENERKESPTMLTELTGKKAWDGSLFMAQLPVYPHRQQAVVEFLRAISPDPQKRKEQLAFLVRMQNELLRPVNPKRDEETGLSILDSLAKANWPERRKIGVDCLEYLANLYTSEKLRGPQLDAYVNPAVRSVKERLLPPFLMDLPQDGPNSRTAVRAEIEQLLAMMPVDSTKRRYVFDHLIETGLENRHRLIEFLLKLPTDEAERTKQIDYLERWNNDINKTYRIGNVTFSQWFHITDPTEMLIAHLVILFIMFLFTIGFCTRVTSVLTWMAAVGYIHRTQQVLFGMDTMMNILLLYLMIGNSGGALSVDRLIARYRAARHSIRRTGGIDDPTQQFLAAPPKSVSAGFALRLLQIHFCIIYLAAGMSKLKGGSWWNTMAGWDTLANPEFTLIHFDWYARIMRWAIQERLVFATASGLMVVFTFVIELGFPFLIWTRLRPYMIALACVFHLGIGCMMGLNLFGLLMMTLILSYIPGRAIRDSLFGGEKLKRFQLQFDPKNETQAKAAATVVMADVEGQVSLQSREQSEYRLTSDGETTPREKVPEVLFRALSLLKTGWLLSFVPGVGKRLTV